MTPYPPPTEQDSRKEPKPEESGFSISDGNSREEPPQGEYNKIYSTGRLFLYRLLKCAEFFAQREGEYQVFSHQKKGAAPQKCRGGGFKKCW